ncbi:MAG: NUDIX domain-containing protein [Comamonadaceae bacterium]|nr:MAG: NUDIX domain-containing protein [Comamonadaceae bacterium]
MPSAHAPTHDVAVFIGRFQPFHNGHLPLLTDALAAAPVCIVVIGSAFHARSPRHPFSWQARAEMIRLALPASDRARVHFVPVRDLHDEAHWLASVRAGVAAQVGAAPGRVLLVGHLKDATTDYLHQFPEWELRAMPAESPATAVAARDALFSQGPDAIAPLLVPAALAPLLRDWCAEPLFAQLQDEWQMLQRYRASWSAAPYPPVLVTVDCVVKCGAHVLLIRRGEAPGKGLLALPGGFMERRETIRRSALRELEEETHLDVSDDDLRACLRATTVFDQPDRSERGRTITHAHFFDLGERPLPAVRADDDAASATWTPIDEIAAEEHSFMDDHFQVLMHFVDLPVAM